MQTLDKAQKPVVSTNIRIGLKTNLLDHLTRKHYTRLRKLAIRPNLTHKYQDRLLRDHLTQTLDKAQKPVVPTNIRIYLQSNLLDHPTCKHQTRLRKLAIGPNLTHKYQDRLLRDHLMQTLDKAQKPVVPTNIRIYLQSNLLDHLARKHQTRLKNACHRT